MTKSDKLNDIAPTTVVDFPVSPEERARRLKAEVERLASLSPTEWLYYLEQGEIAKKHGIDTATLREMIEATIAAAEKKARESQSRRATVRTARRASANGGAARGGTPAA